jgi:mannose-1-phosphate guanylyltransferase
MILPIIKAGSSGSRLWPLSRQQFPKQFLTLLGKHSMLQTTGNRLQGIAHSPALVICNEEHRFSVAEKFRLKNINNSGIIIEPVGRNTAPAAMLAIQDGDDPILLVLAADHVIKNEPAFCETVKQVVEQLKSENRNEWQHHREVYRPWGKYDSIDHGGRFQVKRITVKPGAKLSVQMHHHRAEHWIVVTGTRESRESAIRTD